MQTDSMFAILLPAALVGVNANARVSELVKSIHNYSNVSVYDYWLILLLKGWELLRISRCKH